MIDFEIDIAPARAIDMPMYDSNRPKAYDCFNEFILGNPERLVSIDAAISCVRLEQSQVVDGTTGLFADKDFEKGFILFLIFRWNCMLLLGKHTCWRKC